MRVVVAGVETGSVPERAFPAGRLELRPDPRGRLPGRGAWLHPSLACFEVALRRRAFPRALRVTAGAAGGLETGPVRDYLTAHTTGQPDAADTAAAETVGKDRKRV